MLAAMSKTGGRPDLVCTEDVRGAVEQVESRGPLPLKTHKAASNRIANLRPVSGFMRADTARRHLQVVSRHHLAVNGDLWRDIAFLESAIRRGWVIAWLN